MPTWLSISTSPLFRFALALLVLGLLRLALLSIWEMIQAVRRAGDRRIAFRRVVGETASWMVPLTRIHRARGLFSIASFILHLGILATCLFLGNHLDILQANFGVSWPALAKPVLDVLTLLGIAAGSYLLLFRIYVVSSRKLSNPMDYLLLVMILGLLVSGYLAGQPWNPIPYDGLMLFHALSGIVLLILIPFTKIAHCILYPLIRMGSEVAWHFPARGGSEAIEILHGSEGREI